VWDFGAHLEAVRGFWGERSRVARECVRVIRCAWEVPAWGGVFEGGGGGEMLGRKAVVWMRFVEYLRSELVGLRGLDLMLWCADGSGSGFPRIEEGLREGMRPVESCGFGEREERERMDRGKRVEREKRWREWKWTDDLLSMPTLRQARIACWTAVPPKMEEFVDFGVTVPKFDSWVAGRMVADSALREKMVQDGVVVSEEKVVLGSTENWLRSQHAGSTSARPMEV